MLPVAILAVLVAAACIAGASALPHEIDAGNLTLAVAAFDPLLHRPQPPGYLFHVWIAQAIAALGVPAHRALVWQSACTAALAVPCCYALARRFFPPQLALLLAGTATLSPVALHMGGVALTGIDALWLGAWSLLLLLRAVDGDRRALWGGSLLLGLAGGFRPDVTLFLFLPWLLALRAHRPRQWLAATALLGIGVVAWVLPTAAHCGGLGAFVAACGYVDQILVREAPLFGGSPERGVATWWRLGWALVLTAGPVVASGLLLLPFRRAAIAKVVPPAQRRLLHAAGLPPLVVFAATFFHKKAYLFPVLPALLVLGFAAVLGAGPLRRRTAVLLLANWLFGIAVWTLLPGPDAFYAGPDGFGRHNDELPTWKRALLQPCEHTLAARRGMDQRLGDLLQLVVAERAAGRSVTVVTHPSDPLTLRQVCAADPDLPVVELVGVPGNWQRVLRGRGVESAFAEPGADGRIGIDTDAVVVCVGWDRGWAERLAVDGARLEHLRPTVAFAVVAGPARW